MPLPLPLTRARRSTSTSLLVVRPLETELFWSQFFFQPWNNAAECHVSEKRLKTHLFDCSFHCSYPRSDLVIWTMYFIYFTYLLFYVVSYSDCTNKNK